MSVKPVRLIRVYDVTRMSEHNRTARKEGFPGGSGANAGDLGLIPGFWEDPLEKEMTTDSRILAREVQWTEEPTGYSPLSPERVRHNLVTKQQQVRKELSLTALWESGITPCG